MRILTGCRQRYGVSGGVAVDDCFNGFDTQGWVHTQEVGNETGNMWGSHRRSGDDVSARTNPVTVNVPSVTTLRVPAVP